jgi:hypothetical protein
MQRKVPHAFRLTSMNSIPTSTTTTTSALDGDSFHVTGFNATRPFSSFLPGIAGAYGKPMWVFYANRGQCIASFGVDNKNSAMLEFQPANKAYALTPSHGFRTFLKLEGADGPVLYEPFQITAAKGVLQRLSVRTAEIEIEETCAELALRIRVVYFTLPGEDLPALVRQVTLENCGSAAIDVRVLDGLPQIVPFGLEDRLLKQMSRTMEAFAEIRHVEENLPFFKLKVEPSDKPEVQWINGGFFAFTLRDGIVTPTVVDPDQIFGSDTSLRSPVAFLRDDDIDGSAARRDTMTGCAFANLSLALAPGQSASWSSFYGHATDWKQADALRARAMGDALYTSRKRNENAELIRSIGAQFDLVAGPAQLPAYTRQAFVDNTLRGGQPVVIDGPRGPRVFHTFTRKHGDMERDYNFFEVAASYWSQGNGNFRDVNQNRRSENFIFPDLDASNIETFFNLIQLDGNNPLVIEAEKFLLPLDQLEVLFRGWPAGDTDTWRRFLAQPFSPGQLQERLTEAWGTPDIARPWFDRIIGLSDKIQGAAHGEGYWVDHWIYNLDLLDSFAAVYPDRIRNLLVERRDFTYFDNDHVVQPRDRKYVLRADGTVRQLHAVVQNPEKTRLIAQRSQEPHTMRVGRGTGPIYRTTLLSKILGLMAVKATLFDPFGMGLEMEAEKPGWCDALNGLPGLVGSSTHEAYALQRWSRFTRRALQEPLTSMDVLRLPVEVAELIQAVTRILALADRQDFFNSWQQLADTRESFRATTVMGIDGSEADMDRTEVVAFLDAIDRVLAHALSAALDADGLPVSYYTNTITEFERLALSGGDDAPVQHARARRFVQKPVAPFLEGAVHALRSATDAPRAQAIYRAVRRSALYDDKLGMYRVNTPLDAESFEIGRSRVFSPGWLENESIFLHMHYKFLLETLRSGQPSEFFEDMRRGLVAFQDPHEYGRSPLENSSFIASSRFPDPKVHGVGFVARLSGATAEWISMVLHMGLGVAPFRVVDGAVRFEPRPVLADWLFTTDAAGDLGPSCFGLVLFGKTWVVYDNPERKPTYGDDAVAPVSFELRYGDANVVRHSGAWLPESMALDLREGRLTRLMIHLA